MEPEGSLAHLQESTTCPYTEPAESSPCLPSHFLNIHFNIIHVRLGLPSGPCPSGFLTKILSAPLLYPIIATGPAHIK
jgi:hypothetical protein